MCVFVCVSEVDVIPEALSVDPGVVEYVFVTPPVTSDSDEEVEEMVALGRCMVTEGGMYKGEASNRPACSLIAAATVLFASSSLRT